MTSLRLRSLAALLCLLMVLALQTVAVPAGEAAEPLAAKSAIVRLDVPKAPRAPTVEGGIREEDWRSALRIRRSVRADVPDYADAQVRRWILTKPPTRPDDRPVTFWLMWDEKYLYVAARSPVPDAHPLVRDPFDARPLPPVIHDDICEFAIDASALEPENEAAEGTLMCVLNGAGFQQARRLPPGFRPYGKMVPEQLDVRTGSTVFEDEDGQRWWDVQAAFGRENLNLTREFRAGDRLRISLARVFQFPWSYSALPCASTFMDSDGFPVATLVDGPPAAKFPERAQDGAAKRERPGTNGFLDFRPPRPELAVDLTAFDPHAERIRLQVATNRDRGEERAAPSTLVYEVVPVDAGPRAPLRARIEFRNDQPVDVAIDLSDVPTGEHRLRVAVRTPQAGVRTASTPRGFVKSAGRDGPRYLWWLNLETDAESLRKHDPSNGLGEVSDALNAWCRQGRAAGNVGDFYHNHDRLHSYLDLTKFPQVTPVDATSAKRSLVGVGLQTRKLFAGRVIGNASMVADGLSLAEYAYRRPRLVPALADQYANNHVYLYVSHTTTAEEFSAYTPYAVVCRGSSGSEQRTLESLFAALAAFRPPVKHALTDHRTIAPVLQMLLRRNYDGVETDEQYLSSKAHPVIFDSNKVDIAGMVRHAQAITPNALVPVVRLRVQDETFREADPDERLFTTPGAIARRIPKGQTRTMTVNANDTLDFGGASLAWRWVLLRGDPERTTITADEPPAPEATITVDSQPTRVDIGVFANNGRHWSPPAIISVNPLPDEAP